MMLTTSSFLLMLVVTVEYRIVACFVIRFCQNLFKNAFGIPHATHVEPGRELLYAIVIHSKFTGQQPPTLF